MKTFDYARAWAELARPDYDTRPANIRALFLRTAIAAADCQQGPDLAMIWPDPEKDPRAGGFREMFDTTPAEALAFAARVIYFLGHWKPSAVDVPAGLELPAAEAQACQAGAHWKFSDYADQSLRTRLGLPNDARYGRGVHLEVHEGAIRVCYSSPDVWTWVDVAPATARGKAYADGCAAQVQYAYQRHTAPRRHDEAASEVLAAIKTSIAGWPAEWLAWRDVSNRYMVEEGQQGTPENRTAKLRLRAATLPAQVDAKIAKYTDAQRIELHGRCWWLNHGIDDENLIYYDHTGVFCFGWRQPVGPETLAELLALVSEFPYPYTIKAGPHAEHPNGYTYEGGRG